MRVRVYSYKYWRPSQKAILFLSSDSELLKKRYTQFLRNKGKSLDNLPSMKNWTVLTTMNHIFNPTKYEFRIIDM